MTQPNNQLTQIIQAAIEAQQGLLNFSDFMELALYHPTYGYYQHHLPIGADGDFITAPELSPLFAKCIAKQCSQAFDTGCDLAILELGAGTGQLCCDLLNEFLQSQYNVQYFILERSDYLRQKQQELIKKHYPHLQSSITWLAQLPQNFSGIIFANEVLDALAVDCFAITDVGIQERFVTSKNNEFCWKLAAPRTLNLSNEVSVLQNTYALSAPYYSEINLQLQNFIHALTTCLMRGLILFLDYGYGQAEYYRPERIRGSLTCFYQHQHHDNPFIHVGEQDITTHIDFSRVAHYALAANCQLLSFTTLAAFLLESGILDLAQAMQEKISTEDYFKLSQALKTLLLPTEMGDLIKVMVLGKNISCDLYGMNLQDKRREL